ncbi:MULTISPECIES: phenylalanine--tRNA ligase subunit beta [Pseudonocardia]|uniref:Phenylalanine--tRNA ligase beta subunit n=2 Tax=Pseudonocardia TaxID=1847 RepID=A0A1Y2N3V6_PSEAH|nr:MULTISPECIES: phenylalanine--tRNA ligase subunit beta [Pseudonocardia]OSY41861.1 Phenylalanine--tRNA ligase beta subunit [Pseudonocardia autotrophica]TDN71087.1 phenylalanyl-tRNA synthetase beta subunit [Pseudonocardia autotrophica]BBG01757.1 phenylalanine--tRNA ligase beta subunit [Pseudonocardia autotrophica]GEC26294.1 phenylalanine--tRNA ligase beta subunit [Pseudonocardia saturnea]
MRVSASWLARHIDPAALPARPEDIGDAFVRVGLEVEEIHPAPEITGPLTVARVAEIEELTDFKKPIRYCRVDFEEQGDGSVRHRYVICGAQNFVVGDLVVVTEPGAVLPGGFAIARRETYGRISDGMIASAKELGLGTDHAGILVLPPGTAEPGADALDVLGLAEPVVELAVTPDRGYCFAVRGLARELATSLDLDYTDPAGRVGVPAADGDAWPVRITDTEGCARFVVRRVDGVDPAAPSPWWMQRALLSAGMRPISLIVDVTNFVMLDLGQPLHGYDASRVSGTIEVRRAVAGEKLETLDGQTRVLDPDDLLITDDSGPIGLAGVMGGASTEIPDAADLAEAGDGARVDVLIEAAHFASPVIARAARRHKLPSEASRRFERVVDPALPPVAAERAAQLLVELGGGTLAGGRTDEGGIPPVAPVRMPLSLPDRVAGVAYPRGATVRRLSQVGCTVELDTGADGQGVVVATPPTWRPDLRMAADLVEEVLRLEGYDTIPSVLPTAPAGRGLTPAQLRRRAVSRALAESGHVEVLPFPFVADTVWNDLGLAVDDDRRRTVAVTNPLDAERSRLTTTLLPGLLDMLVRNRSRGSEDLALYTIAQVVAPQEKPQAMPDPAVTGRPSDEEYAAIRAALPAQPLHVGVVLAGNREPRGWWGAGRPATWEDAVEAARLIGAAAGVELRPRRAERAPWHPGRCAELVVAATGTVVGHAGELHPKVVEAFGLPARTAAAEIDLDAIELRENLPVPRVSAFPPVAVDVALVADLGVPAADLAEALTAGAGELLESVRLFDVYTGDQVGDGKRSLAFSLRLRAGDRTLTGEEANAARDAAVAEAGTRHGAVLR